MAFTRDELASYEKQTPSVVDDTLETAFAPPAASQPASTPPAAVTPEDASAVTPATAAASPAAEDTDPAALGGEPSADTTADSATASAQPEGDTSTEADGQQPPVKGTARDRIEGLVAENKALRTYVEYREQLWKQGAPAAPAAAPGSTPAASAAPKPAAPTPRPTLEQFNYDLEAYNAADEAWIEQEADRRAAAKLNQAQSEQAATAAKTAEQEVRQKFATKLTEFAKSHEDFPVVAASPMLNSVVSSLSPVTQRQLVVSDHSAAILYHLGKHLDVATRIARMPPEQQLVALGKIEAQVTQAAPSPAPTPPKQKVLSQAPPPPSLAPSGGVRERSPTDPSLSMDEFVAMERKKEIQKREARKALRASR